MLLVRSAALRAASAGSAVLAALMLAAVILGLSAAADHSRIVPAPAAD